MGYHFMNIEQMKQMDLFDNIPYKYIKNIINNDEEVIDVVIEHLDCDIIAYCKTRFTFEILQDTEDKYAKFVVETEYNGSSAFAMLMGGLDDALEEEEEEEEEEPDDE
tara:strand:+ start:233 stop:556 length:324 start_codon:yes stop_codon:yes gene_type:complete